MGTCTGVVNQTEAAGSGGAIDTCQKIGVWNDSGVTGSGVVISTSGNQFAQIVAADDNSEALGANWYGAGFSHMLIGYANSARTNVSAFGHAGELHLAATTSPGGNYAGLYGYAEITAGKTYSGTRSTSFSGVLAGIDVPATAVINTNAVMSAYAAGAGTLGGTHTGYATVLHVTNPGTGTFDAAFSFDTDTGCSNLTAHSTTNTEAGNLIVLVNEAGTWVSKRIRLFKT